MYSSSIGASGTTNSLIIHEGIVNGETYPMIPDVQQSGKLATAKLTNSIRKVNKAHCRLMVC